MTNVLTQLKQLLNWDARSQSQQQQQQQQQQQPILDAVPPRSSIVSVNRANPEQAIDILPEPRLHKPLLDALAKFERANLRASQIVFHGCATATRDTDCTTRRLYGTRKWFSSNAAYAVDYAGAYGDGSDGGMLWICQTERSIPALIGSQNSLQCFAPWQPYEFPWKLPDEFERYAQNILHERGSVALLDHRGAVGFDEILITSPEHLLRVVDIIRLPQDREKARAIGSMLNDRYAENR